MEKLAKRITVLIGLIGQNIGMMLLLKAVLSLSRMATNLRANPHLSVG